MTTPTPDPRVLGLRLAEARKARGITQEAAATHLGCSRPTYIAIEKGERAAKPEEVVKLAAFFGKQVHDLMLQSEPVADLQPHLRAVADRMQADDPELIRGIADLQQFAEDYRELERSDAGTAPQQAPRRAAPRGRGGPDRRGRGRGHRREAAARPRGPAGHQPAVHPGDGGRPPRLLRRPPVPGRRDVRLRHRPRVLHPHQPQAPARAGGGCRWSTSGATSSWTGTSRGSTT